MWFTITDRTACTYPDGGTVSKAQRAKYMDEGSEQ